MSFVNFPEPADLEVPFIQRIGDSKNIIRGWTVENPHPGYGKDPNILNEYGHTKYPMFVGNVIVNNEAEEKEARGEASVPNAGWGAKPELRTDGPTVHEYVAASYKASEYPPKGYASKSTDEEIKAAIEAEHATKSSGWGSTL